jgi:hypothetical protein
MSQLQNFIVHDGTMRVIDLGLPFLSTIEGVQMIAPEKKRVVPFHSGGLDKKPI